MIETILLTVSPITTFQQQLRLTNATGFFFERDERLFLVTCRHVMLDEPARHHPDRIEIELHTNAENLAESVAFSIPLYYEGKSAWRQGEDSGGAIDVAVIEVRRSALPKRSVYYAFTKDHLLSPPAFVGVGTSLLVIGFPLGFLDTLHRTPVARQAGVASSFGFRFQGGGYFLTDARTHRGSSGAPVVMRSLEPSKEQGELPWVLLGVHSGTFDMGSRDQQLDEALGLNCAWYADILLALTDGA
ncbi:MAG TPA: serine protease [Verrucomicrobiales bacterium]|nr:serine protease [Verrucomicrobiales bacterium]